MASKRYTDEDFIKAVKESISIRQVLEKLGLVTCGGNYFQANLKIKRFQLDTSHFSGQGHLKGKTHSWAKKKPLKEILVKNSRYNGHLRERLLKEGIFENKCYKCGITEWNGKPISCELEHKNGDHFDNRIENLTFLCPNCHSQTRYFRGKNKKIHEEKTIILCVECGKILSETRKNHMCFNCYKGYCKRSGKNGNNRSKGEETKCPDCGVSIGRKSKRCISCSHKQRRKTVRPSKEELKDMLKKETWTSIGRRFGVSDNTIRKWIKAET